MDSIHVLKKVQATFVYIIITRSEMRLFEERNPCVYAHIFKVHMQI